MIKTILYKYGFKILEAFVIFLITISLVFALLYLIPGRIATVGDVHISDEAIQEAQSAAGITGNFIVDYFKFLGHALTFDFGQSIAMRPGQDINSFLWTKLGLSFTITSIAIILSLILAIPLAIWFARKPGKAIDGIGMFFVSIAIAVPSFIIGVLLMILGSKMGLNPTFELDKFSSWIMPIISLTLAPTAAAVVLLRSGIIESRNDQFVKFAKVKGAKRNTVEYKHILKLSLFPIITYLPSSFLGAFLGSMLVENIFGIPGAGKLLSSAISGKDYTLVQAIMTISILLVILSYLTRDITYKMIDPRTK